MSCNHRLIRAGLVVAIASLATGCIRLGGGDVGAIYQAAKTAWSGGEKVTLQEAASVPYASIGVQVGGSTELMLLLASDTAGRQLWTSGQRIAISTDQGRIVRTAGLEHDLTGYELNQPGSGSDGKSKRWKADFSDLRLFSVPIVCQEHLTGNETIVILGKEILTRRIEETCKTEGALDWSFTNVYWRDPASGLAWRSIQHVHPRQPAIETEILRPPA